MHSSYASLLSVAVTLRYYRSTDATITTADTEVGTGAVTELFPSGSASDSVDLTAPTAPGTYYYGACMDTVPDERDAAHACSTSVQVVVPELARPDLQLAVPTVSDSGPLTGTRFTLSMTVRNDGNGFAAATTLRYYRSTDAALAARDSASNSVKQAASESPLTEVGTDYISGLAARGSASDSVELEAPATPGNYYYSACVDAVTDELDTKNNCSTSAQITVQLTVTELQGDPDLAVTSASVSDSGPAAGAQFTLSATVRNDGNGAAAATTLRYYRSSDATITTSDTDVGTDAITRLAAAGSSSQSVELTSPATPGTYYYGACVDTVTDETDTTNNCSTSVQVVVREPERPDLIVAAPTASDSDPAAGAQFSLSATVRNDGNGAAAATTLRYYRSSDATITTSDTQVGTDAITQLGGAGSSSLSVELTAPAGAGTYYYGACVDAVADELDTTNNCSPELEMTVGPAVTEPADDCAANTSTTCRVRIAGFVTHTIETAGDRDWVLLEWVFAGGELLKGHRFIVSVEGRTGDRLETSVMEVLDSTGNQLTPRAVDDSGSGTATVTFVADATASYYVEVSAFDPNATGAYRVFTVNTTSSTIQELEIISDPGADNTYSADDEIEVRVIFSALVEVTGTPQLALDIGGVIRQASYTDGTGTQFLTFSYTVADGDSDTDGIEISANSVTTPSGSGIRADGMDVPLQHNAVPADSGHQVNGSGSAAG